MFRRGFVGWMERKRNPTFVFSMRSIANQIRTAQKRRGKRMSDCAFGSIQPTVVPRP
jgi:hypothetical protein